MIKYFNKESWFKAIGRMLLSKVFTRILFTVIVVNIIAGAEIVILMEVFKGHDLDVPQAMFQLLGIILSILLVFRINSAYDRWWEGRKLWGSLVNSSRNLAIQIHTTLPPEDTFHREFFARHISNFPFALKNHLRGTPLIDGMIGLSEAEQKFYAINPHLPNYLSYRIFFGLERARKSGKINEMQYLSITGVAHELMNITGACERIKNSPIPFSYSSYLKLFMVIYIIILPLGLVHSFQYAAWFATIFVSFIMSGIELIAEEIEDPFGLDANDLNLNGLSFTIRNNVALTFQYQPYVTKGEAISEGQDGYL